MIPDIQYIRLRSKNLTMTEAALVGPDTADPCEDYSRYQLNDLFKEVRLLMAQRHALEYRLSTLLRELDQRDDLDG